VLRVVWLEVETWIIGKGGAKRGGHKGEMGGWGKMYGAAEFCGPSV
jgi:hypothetical protein